MPFIGQEPITGAFHKLDAITTSSTNTYNLLLNGGAYSPASANHLMVSLNGVIQSPGSSFTISGSQITFVPSSGTLSSSDSIDFIMAYGDVLNIGTPTDGTVSENKIVNGAVTDAKIASGVSASKLTGALPAIDGSALTGISSKYLQTKFSSRLGATNISSTSFQEISTSLRVSITISDANSILLFTCPLYTEVDGSGGHGMAELQYSTDSGSSFTSYDTYNITAATDNDIGFGFTDFFDHSFSAGTTVIFRVRYRLSNTGSGHAIADTGPGESPASYLLVQEVLV